MTCFVRVHLRPILYAALVAVTIGACATPVAPSGGPEDVTPPEIVDSDPAPGTVNVSGQSVRITFSEYVNEGSLRNALSVSPAPAQPPVVTFSGRTADIELTDPLRPNTTYVVTLDTELRDIRGVALRTPIVFAFSSGAALNEGTLSGRIVTYGEGAAASGVDVFVYALPDSAAPDSLPSRPHYRTQSGPSGTFTLEYLTEQHYYVVGVRDQNRNLAVDPQEPFAVPPVAALLADPDTTAVPAPWILTRLDTTAPAPLRAQSLSSSRHALRLSEPVDMLDRDPSSWTLSDSATGEPVGVEALYVHQHDPRQVYFTTPPLPPTTHTIRPAALADTSGNLVEDRSVTFVPAARDDTLRTRFLTFLPDTGGAAVTLPRGIEAGVRFNSSVSQDVLRQAVRVIDSTDAPLEFLAVTEDGTNYRLMPQPALAAGARADVIVNGGVLANPDSTYRTRYIRLDASLTGEIGGVVSSAIHPIVVQASPIDAATPDYATTTDSTGHFIFPGLRAGSYRLRAFADTDGDGEWTGGRLVPYQPSEPVFWLREPIRVRARWETSLPDTLRIRDAL